MNQSKIIIDCVNQSEISIDYMNQSEISIDSVNQSENGTHLHGRHQTRCSGPASREVQAEADQDPGTQLVSLINIESLFSLLFISLIFRLDFSLTT